MKKRILLFLILTLYLTVNAYAFSPAMQAVVSSGGAKQTQTITYGTPPGASLTVPNTESVGSATVPWGGPITYGTTAAGTICTVAGTTVTAVGEGDCPVTADQAGDGYHSAASQVHEHVTISAGGCTPSAVGTVLVGTNTTSTAEVAAMAANQEWFWNTGWAASWAGDCTTETVGTIEVFLKAVDVSSCKALLGNSDGTLVTNGISNARTDFDWEENPDWHIFTMGTPPTITKGTTYLLGIVCNVANSPQLPYNNAGSATLCCEMGTPSYATPGTMACDSYDDNSATVGGFRGKK
jgi:hypothetical protein